MMLFILVKVQNKIALIIILVNLLGEAPSELFIYHGGRDQKSHLFRHAEVNEHRNASYDDSKIIGSSFRTSTFKRKVAKALLIKELPPTVNVQEKVG